jgi:hypothetical protein
MSAVRPVLCIPLDIFRWSEIFSMAKIYLLLPFCFTKNGHISHPCLCRKKSPQKQLSFPKKLPIGLPLSSRSRSSESNSCSGLRSGKESVSRNSTSWFGKHRKFWSCTYIQWKVQDCQLLIVWDAEKQLTQEQQFWPRRSNRIPFFVSHLEARESYGHAF